MTERRTVHAPDVEPSRARPIAARDVQSVGSRPEWLVGEARIQRLQRLAGNAAVNRAVRSGGTTFTVAPLHSVAAAIQRNAKFDQMAEGGAVTEEGAPKEMQLPSEFRKGMNEAWVDSFPDGKSQEQGGILVLTKEGEYEWREGPPGSGGSFTPNYGDVKDGETIIAVGHTHPYDETEGGTTKVSFSGEDLASFVYAPEKMQVVQSGSMTFTAVRTDAWDTLLAAADTASKKKALYKEICDNWDAEIEKARKEKGVDFVKSVEKAAIAVCQKYHFVYYSGKSSGIIGAPTQKQAPKPKVHVEKAKQPKKKT